MKAINRRQFLAASAAAGLAVSTGHGLSRIANAKEPIQPTNPSSAAGNELLNLLQKRRSSREFSTEPLPRSVLSRLLWAAFGINRPDGRRTAPSARNRQEIDIYVAARDALYLYDPKGNILRPIVAEDLRALTGMQSFVKEAAVNLVYVADMGKIGDDLSPEQKTLWTGADTGVIVQNVYLFCAAEGLATAVRAMIDRPPLAKAMRLRSDQVITLSQSVGYPRKAG
jgi:nitroreductase